MHFVKLWKLAYFQVIDNTQKQGYYRQYKKNCCLQMERSQTFLFCGKGLTVSHVIAVGLAMANSVVTDAARSPL